MAVPDDLIELGSLRGAYGVRGWVKVAPLSPEADTLRAVGSWWLQGVGDAAPRAVGVEGVRRHGGGLVAKLAGCELPEQAEALRGQRVFAARSQFPALPAGQFYWLDLIGARVVNRQGEDLGAVRGLRSNGVHDVLEIEDDQQARPQDGMAEHAAPRAFLLPLVADYVDGIESMPAVAASGAAAGGRPLRIVRVDWDRSWN